MNIIDLIIASLIVAIIIVTSASSLWYTKISMVDAENYHEANKFSMATLEKLQPLPYTDSIDHALDTGTHTEDLPADCKLVINYSGKRSYEVKENHWDSPGTTYNYKEINVTTSWKDKGNDKSVKLGVLKRDDTPPVP